MFKVNYLVIVLIMNCSCLIFGMEEGGVAIVNYNEGDFLPVDIDSAAVFGSTPSLSRLNEFTGLVVADIEGIKSAKNRKGMRKEIGELKRTRLATLTRIKEAFKQNPNSDCALQCFFQHGFKRQLLEENFEVLVEAVSRTNATNLVHIFLPSYFNPKDFGDALDQERQSLVKDFLVYSAQFYKSLYEKQKLMQRVYIVIPPIDDFIEKIAAQHNDVDVIVDLLKEQLLDKGIKRVTLVNQNEQQLVDIGTKFGEIGYLSQAISLMRLIIYQGCTPTNIFNPYTIPTNKIPSSCVSCVISKDFVSTFESLESERAENE